MSRCLYAPLTALVVVLALLAGVWSAAVFGYAVSEESIPPLLVGAWLALWGMFALLVVWLLARLIRAARQKRARWS